MKVLDHGEVVLLDVMGSDQAIGDAARVSYHPASTKQKNSLEGLIRYLLCNAHTSPFEMVEFKFYIKMPIYVARQWIRHRTANVNEMSGRYSILPEEFHVPELDELCYQSDSNKQGSGGPLPEDMAIDVQTGILNKSIEAFYYYHDLVNQAQGEEGYDPAHPGLGMSKEMGRIVLPLNTYTEMVWKIDLHNLFHFLKLRTDSHAQRQIRVFADAIEDMVAATCPIAYRAWVDYSKKAHKASRMETAILRNLITRIRDALGDDDLEINLDKLIDDSILQHRGLMTGRELTAFRAKFLAE